MSKHTPGPWKAEGYKGLVVNGPDGVTLACAPGGKNIEETIANAHLIAAAPDLLAALKAVVDNVDRGDSILRWSPHYVSENALDTDDFGNLDSARAAIARAEGRDTP